MKCLMLMILVTMAQLVWSQPARADWPEETMDTIDFLMSEYSPARNEYSSPSKIEVVNGQLWITAVCGGFVAQLLQMSYPGVVTSSLLKALTGSSGPNSSEWYQAIVQRKSVTTGAGVYGFHRREKAADIAPGDILASEYFKNGDTGHTMLVYAVGAPSLVSSTIPGYSTVWRYPVTVVDATKSVHSNSAGSTDTRYRSDVDAMGAPVNDRGFGRGDIYLYAEPAKGTVVGWTWSVKQSVAYQGVDNTPSPGVGEYRPIVAGRLRGPGIGTVSSWTSGGGLATP